MPSTAIELNCPTCGAVTSDPLGRVSFCEYCGTRFSTTTSGSRAVATEQTVAADRGPTTAVRAADRPTLIVDPVARGKRCGKCEALLTQASPVTQDDPRYGKPQNYAACDCGALNRLTDVHQPSAAPPIVLPVKPAQPPPSFRRCLTCRKINPTTRTHCSDCRSNLRFASPVSAAEYYRDHPLPPPEPGIRGARPTGTTRVVGRSILQGLRDIGDQL
jgi:hypothetical protein